MARGPQGINQGLEDGVEVIDQAQGGELVLPSASSIGDLDVPGEDVLLVEVPQLVVQGDVDRQLVQGTLDLPGIVAGNPEDPGCHLVGVRVPEAELLDRSPEANGTLVPDPEILGQSVVLPECFPENLGRSSGLGRGVETGLDVTDDVSLPEGNIRIDVVRMKFTQPLPEWVDPLVQVGEFTRPTENLTDPEGRCLGAADPPVDLGCYPGIGRPGDHVIGKGVQFAGHHVGRELGEVPESLAREQGVESWISQEILRLELALDQANEQVGRSLVGRGGEAGQAAGNHRPKQRQRASTKTGQGRVLAELRGLPTQQGFEQPPDTSLAIQGPVPSGHIGIVNELLDLLGPAGDPSQGVESLAVLLRTESRVRQLGVLDQGLVTLVQTAPEILLVSVDVLLGVNPKHPLQAIRLLHRTVYLVTGHGRCRIDGPDTPGFRDLLGKGSHVQREPLLGRVIQRPDLRLDHCPEMGGNPTCSLLLPAQLGEVKLPAEAGNPGIGRLQGRGIKQGPKVPDDRGTQDPGCLLGLPVRCGLGNLD